MAYLKKKQKVLIALSGGIDSAVSAYLLLKQGYEVEAAFMKNWSDTKGLKYDECPWLQDRQDAIRVAAFLRIPLHTLDFEKQYEKHVLDYFFKEYAAGRTPNPDVMCNKEIKFKLLYDWAMKNGFNFLATGHYAQVRITCPPLASPSGDGRRENQELRIKGTAKVKTKPEELYFLKRSADEFKDQTYFIYNIKKEQLPHVLFPIGGMKKPQVKALAIKIKLPNAQKRESMGLCFVGRIRLKDFLEQKIKLKPGAIIDQDGKTLGRHQGLSLYTIGQRQGIQIGATGPYYVYGKNMVKNELYVTNDPNDPKLSVTQVSLHTLNWLVDKPLKGQKLALTGRFRHQGELVPLTLIPQEKGSFCVIFNKPQKAIASGQSLVLYKGKICVGGGVIE